MAGYFCGPMCVITLVGYLLNKPWRHITQPITVTAQAYGLLITWIPAYFVNLIHVPTWSWSLYYGYFWLMQCPWLIIPCLLVYHSCSYINKLYKDAKKIKEK